MDLSIGGFEGVAPRTLAPCRANGEFNGVKRCLERMAAFVTRAGARRRVAAGCCAACCHFHPSSMRLSFDYLEVARMHDNSRGTASFGPFQLSPESRRLERDGVPLALGGLAFARSAGGICAFVRRADLFGTSTDPMN